MVHPKYIPPPNIIPKSPLSNILQSWEIPAPEHDRMDRYYLLSWKSDYLFETLNNFPTNSLSHLTHQEIEYNIIYHQCIPKTLHAYTDVLLSFRRINGWERGYVLIRPKFGTERYMQS